MRYHLFQKFFGKMVKIKETSFHSARGMILIFGNCTSICHIGETDVRTTANKMYFSHSTAICCKQHLVIKSTFSVHLGINYSKKS